MFDIYNMSEDGFGYPSLAAAFLLVYSTCDCFVEADTAQRSVFSY